MAEQCSGSPGALRLVGYWLSFHDAEILRARLNRTGASAVQAQTLGTGRVGRSERILRL